MYIHLYQHLYRYVHIYAAVSNGKRKPRRLYSIHLPFAHCANGTSSFFHLFTKKRTEVFRICKLTKQTCPSTDVRTHYITGEREFTSSQEITGPFITRNNRTHFTTRDTRAHLNHKRYQSSLITRITRNHFITEECSFHQKRYQSPLHHEYSYAGTS